MSITERLEMLSDLEKKYAVELDREYRGYGNEIVRELIASVMIDSQKHAGLYKAAAMLASGKSLAITEEEFNLLEEKLKLHIEKEKEMLEAVTKLMEEVEDDRIKKILIMIYEDELMHHPFMTNFLDLVIKRETITEQDIWDQLFRDLPTHGHVADPYVGRDYGP